MVGIISVAVHAVSRLSTRGSGEEGRYVNGKGKEQGSENEAGGGGGKHVNKAFMSSFYPLVIITSII